MAGASLATGETSDVHNPGNSTLEGPHMPWLGRPLVMLVWAVTMCPADGGVGHGLLHSAIARA